MQTAGGKQHIFLNPKLDICQEKLTKENTMISNKVRINKAKGHKIYEVVDQNGRHQFNVTSAIDMPCYRVNMNDLSPATMIPIRVLYSDKLSASEKIAYFTVLSHRIENTCVAFGSLNQLAKDMCLTRQTAKKCFDKLVELNMLKEHRLVYMGKEQIQYEVLLPSDWKIEANGPSEDEIYDEEGGWETIQINYMSLTN